MWYVNYRLDPLSKTETAEFLSQTRDGSKIFVINWKGKKRQLEKNQVIKIYDPETGEERK